MSRQKRIIRFSDNMLEDIEEYFNLEETMKELDKRYYDPEISSYITSQNDIASSIITRLAAALNIKGKPDMKQVEEEYDYYSSVPRFQYSSENKVKPEYRKN